MSHVDTGNKEMGKIYEGICLFQGFTYRLQYSVSETCQEMPALHDIDSHMDDMDAQDDPESEKESKPITPDKDVVKFTLENEEFSMTLDENGPLKTFIDNFKQKYNISVEPNDIAIFV